MEWNDYLEKIDCELLCEINELKKKLEQSESSRRHFQTLYREAAAKNEAYELCISALKERGTH